jgi:hypothetical protein
MDDDEIDTITIPQLVLAGIAAFTILGVALVWNAVSLAASAVQEVKRKFATSEPYEL